MLYKFNIDEQNFEVEVAGVEKDVALVYVNGTPYTVNIENMDISVPVSVKPVQAPKIPSSAVNPSPVLPKRPTLTGSGVITAQIPGLIIKVKVNVGDTVTAGQVVAVMEAMKMENDITSPVSGTVKEIQVQKGMDVSTGDVIMILE